MNKTGLTEVVVQFRGGTYFFPKTAYLTSADSGTAATPIVYENFPGESPVFSGGLPVTGWTKGSGNKWTVSLPASAAYFENLYYNGKRKLRPRLGGYLGTFYRMKTVYVDDAAAMKPENQYCSIHVTGKGWECFDRFQYDPTDPISSAWKNLAQPANANSKCDAPNGSTSPVGDIAVLDFEQFSTSKLLISCIDTSANVVYLTGATAAPANNYTETGFIDNHRYLVENVEDAFNQPGQWFLDHTKKPWTLSYIAASPFENPNFDSVIIPQLPQILVAAGLSYVTFHGLTFAHGLFTIPSPQGYVSRENEPIIGAAVSLQNSQYVTFDANTITQTDGVGLDIISCTQSGSPSWCMPNSMNSNATTASITVQNSAFYDLGVHGVRVGMPGLPLDTAANTPYNITVQNNVIEGYGRSIPASFGIAGAVTHDSLFAHNDVYDGYHAAISVTTNLPARVPPNGGSGVFNDVISYNHVYNLLQGIMNDGGSIRFENGSAVSDLGGNQVSNNWIHDVTDASIQDPDGYGGHGIYLDNDTGRVDIKNNLVYRVSGAAVHSPHGPNFDNQPNLVHNNIFAFARQAMINDTFPYFEGVPANTVHQIFDVRNNIFYFDRNLNSPGQAFSVQGGCSYSNGMAYTSFESFASNLYWRTDGNFAKDTDAFHQQLDANATAKDAPCSSDTSGWKFYSFAQWRNYVGEDANSVIQDPGFLWPSFPFDNYWMPKGSPGAGFVPFNPYEAGRTFPLLRPPEVAPSFPTMRFNPATDY
jgi:hypothetical protein